MKQSLIILGITLILVGVLYFFQDDLQQAYYSFLRDITEETIQLEKNEYYRDYDFNFVQNTDDFEPNNEQDILNIFYTVINSGMEDFTFYCPDTYSECLNDVESLANNQDMLSHINNFVHPFNGFNHIETKYDSLGKVDIHVQKSYTKEEIDQITDKVNSLSEELIDSSDSDENNVRRVHDYIIDHTVYDSGRSDYSIATYESDLAYGPLFEGYGICGGYTDAMELFLEKMRIKSYKISSDQHVWNAVYLNHRWYHLDLTWDDPVTDTGENVLEHKFFLINTPTLLSLEQTEHRFDQNIYSELKEA